MRRWPMLTTKGKIVSLDALRAQEQQAKAEAFRTADRQEVLKRFPTLANDMRGWIP